MKPIYAFLRVCLISTTFIAGTASAWRRDEARDEILVLGDSVAFSYIASAGYGYVNPDNFIGFPLYLGRVLGLEPVDAGCPGETTGSFLSAPAPDLGCRGFRKNFPLHVSYGGSQLEFAKRYLKSHHNVRVVTITLGSNDGFLLEASCDLDPACILAGLPAMRRPIDNLSSDRKRIAITPIRLATEPCKKSVCPSRP